MLFQKEKRIMQTLCDASIKSKYFATSFNENNCNLPWNPLLKKELRHTNPKKFAPSILGTKSKTANPPQEPNLIGYLGS